MRQAPESQFSVHPSTENGKLGKTIISSLALLMIFIFTMAVFSAEIETSSDGVIQGSVLRRDQALPLAGAEVQIRGVGIVATTDSEGRFTITGVPSGTYIIEAHAPGFEVHKISGVELRPGETTTLLFELEPVRFLKELVVTPSHYSLYRENPGSQTSMSREEVTRMPHLADDLFRALERVPGATGEDVSAKINIRGGDVDEVLVVVDGLEIYDGFHLKDLHSLFSIIAPETIGGMELMTGGFTSEYGNRMSGVIDISSSTASEDHRTTFGASTTNFTILSEGIFGDNQRGQWLVSARRTFLDMVMEWVDPDSGLDPSFYDLFFSLKYAIGDRSMLSFDVLGAKDDLIYIDYDDTGTVEEEYLDATNSSGYSWLNLKTTWSADLFSTTVLSFGSVEHQRDGWLETGESNGTVDDGRDTKFFAFKQDWALDIGANNVLTWGFDIRKLDTEYHYRSLYTNNDRLWVGAEPRLIRRFIDLDFSGNQYSLYLANRIRLADTVVAELGVRWDDQDWIDDAQVSPRLNIAWNLAPNTVLRGSWGVYHQPEYIYELQVSDGVTEFAPAQRSEHYLIALEHGFGLYNMRCEAYFKDITDVRPYYENQLNPIELMPEMEPDRILVESERAEARGIELTVRREGRGAWSWWASYAYSKAEDLIDGEWVPRSWDQPHTLNASVNFKPNERWNLNVAGVYHTGWPTTGIGAELLLTPAGDPYINAWLEERNQERYDDYLRFDIRGSRTFGLRSSQLMVFLEVINLFNRENLGRIDNFGFRLYPDGSAEFVANREDVLPMIPTLGLRWTF